MSKVATKLDRIFLFGVRAAVLWACTLAGPLRAATAAISHFPELFSLTPQQLSEGRPLALEATVLGYDRAWNQLFLHTPEATIYVPPQGQFPPLAPGDVIRLRGVTCAAEGQFPLTNLVATRVGTAALPPPLPATRPTPETQWVEVLTRIRIAEASRERLALTLPNAGFPWMAYVLGGWGTNDCKDYSGATVRLRGISTSRLVNGRPVQSDLLVPNASFVSIIQPPATPLRNIPVTSIDALLNRELDSWTNELIHLNGLVDACEPGDSVLVRDPTGTLRARVRQVNTAPIGQRVDVWGYLDASAAPPELIDAYFELVPAGPIAGVTLPVPAALTNLPARTVTNIAQLRAWPPAELSQGFPVKLRGALIYADPEWQTGFVADPSAGIYVRLEQTNVQTGDLVEVTGRAAVGAFGPVVMQARLLKLGHTNLPAPIQADLDDVAEGDLDARWVEMSGVIRNAYVEWNHLHLSVMTRKGKFAVVVPGFSGTNAPAHLLDSRAAFRGVCGSELNARKQINGITLHVPSLSEITTIEPAANISTLAATPAGAVASFDPDHIAGRRIKVAGTVTLIAPGVGLFVQDASGGIRVQAQAAQELELRPGDSVEVLGFPALGEFSPHLEEPTIHRLGSGPLPAPATVTAEHILLHGTNDCTLVTLEAELLQRIPRSAQPKLILQQGAIIFTAQLAKGNLPAAYSDWRPGALVRVTGLCAIQGTDNHNPQSFRVLLASPDQFQLLHSPAAWSLGDFLLLLGGVVLAGMFALGWIALLRRQVRSRTADLRASKARLRKQFEHSQALSELGHRLNAAATPKQAALIITDVADRLIGWNSCICDLYNPETDTITHVLTIDEVDGKRCECQPGYNELRPSVLARRAIELGPQLVLRTPEQLGEPLADGTVPFGNTQRLSASLLYVPVRNGATVLGLLSIQSYTPGAYDAADLASLQALADHCSGALERIATHEQLVEISRRAGMAEVATGVLHNVGNVLNSVNVSVTLLLDRARDSHAERLQKVAALLQAHRQDLSAFFTSDPKGRRIPEYVSQVATAMRDDEAQARTELESLARHVEHIKEIVSMQQSYARLAGVSETFPAVELAEDALRLNAGTLSRHHIQIRRDYAPDLPNITVEKHKVLQILINLIRNAKYACDESGREDKIILVAVEAAEGRVRISIQDNGVGIAPENLTRIFSLGFSTRKSGHGFGLHSAALAARELGGSLWAQSDGRGTGATFVLELPLDPAPPAAEARPQATESAVVETSLVPTT